jgi:adenylate cyclase
MPTEEEFRSILTGEHPDLVKFRRIFRRVPSSPRCKLCSAPFEGAGGAILRHVGFARFAGNPAMCVNCVTDFRKSGVTGAEIPLTMLFADIRGSTGIGERLSPREFKAFLDCFYRIASDVVLDHDGLVDKFVGDEVIGLFFGGVSGKHHAAAAIAAALDLAERCGRPDATPSGPIPLGTAVHYGTAIVGPSGPPGAVDDFTALGDSVNTTARLASEARAGEVLVSSLAVAEAGTAVEGAERRTLDIRGRQGTMDVFVLRSAATALAVAPSA